MPEFSWKDELRHVLDQESIPVIKELARHFRDQEIDGGRYAPPTDGSTCCACFYGTLAKIHAIDIGAYDDGVMDWAALQFGVALLPKTQSRHFTDLEWKVMDIHPADDKDGPLGEEDRLEILAAIETYLEEHRAQPA